MIFDVESSNPNTIGYYLLYIFVLLLTYFVIILISYLTKARLNGESHRECMDTQVITSFTEEQKNLRFKYLLVSTAIRAAVWVKAPYIFALYNRLHGFERSDIGILYAIDNSSALIMGPILGSLGDIYGRKKFCVLYCLIVISHITIRLTGNRMLAYFAQFLTGIAGALIETAFESWLNFEATFLFSEDEIGKYQKNYFLKDIFSKQVTIDCYTSIILTGFASFLYINFGLTFPFYSCILFSLLAALTIIFNWEENDIEKMQRMKTHLHSNQDTSLKKKLLSAWSRLKRDKPLLSIGIIESSFRISLQLFIFIWTPLLEETANGYINPGSVFVCFMIARLMGSELFELSKMILQINSYFILLFIVSTAALSFLIDYEFANFNARLFMFVYFDGLSGIFNPLLSTLKSQMIPEVIRTTIMNFFRIPINIFSILSLIFTAYINTYQICLVAFLFMLIGVFVNLYLICIHSPPDEMKNSIKHYRDANKRNY